MKSPDNEAMNSNHCEERENRIEMKRLTGHIFMIGFMGVGKTSTSKALSKGLGVRDIDTDDMIVKQAGMPISQIFQEQGEEAFRRMETELLDEIEAMAPCVVSCGGGMVLRQENVEKMKRQGKILLLSASPETIYEHVKGCTNRPLLEGHMNVEYISKLMAEREPQYEAAADWKIVCDELTPRMTAEKIMEVL